MLKNSFLGNKPVRNSVIFLIGLIYVLSLSSFVKADTYLGNISDSCQETVSELNPVTNKLYRGGNNKICVINGVDNSTSIINLPITVSELGINTVTNKIYAGNSDVLYVIDGANNSSQLIYFNSPSEFIGDIVVNSVTDKIYLTESDSATNTSYLRIINGTDNSLQSLSLPAQNLSDVAVDVKNNRLFLVAHYEDKLLVVNTSNNTLTASISLPTFAASTNLSRVVFNELTDKIYCSWSGFENRIAVIDANSFSVSYITTGLSETSILDINPRTNKLYFSSGQAGNYNIYSIDGNNFIQTVETDTFFVQNFEINKSANKLYLSNSQTDSVKIINENDNFRQTVSAGNEPGRIIINPVTNKIYVGRYALSDENGTVVIDGDDNKTETVSIGQIPYQIAVTPSNNKIYSVNSANNAVSVVNGVNNSFQNIAVGTNPQAIAVNRITNRVYVANFDSNDVTVIDPSNNSTIQVPVGTNPQAIAVNEVTNKIYVADFAGSVTVIDGTNNVAHPLATATNDARSIAVNATTNKIYVASYANSNVIVIDGFTNEVLTLDFLNSPEKLAVNPVTNKIYVIDRSAGNLWIINGADNTFEALDIGAVGVFNDIDVNPLTNRIYIANGSEIVVINGQNNTFSTVAAGVSPRTVRVNSAANKIYAANFSSGNVTMIDGLTNVATNFAVGSQPSQIAVNPLTNKIYTANRGSNNVTVAEALKLSHPTLATTAQSLSGNTTDSAAPTFNLTAAVSNFGPAPRNIYFQVDTINGSWQKATNIFGTSVSLLASATTSPISQGVHTIYFFTTDGTDSTITQNLAENPTSDNFSNLNSGNTGAVNGYQFAVKFAPTAASVSIKGRIVTADGQGIKNAILTLTDQNGAVREVFTGSLGHFSFDEVTVGETYFLSVHSKRFRFNSDTQVITLKDEITDLVFTAETSF